MSTVDIEDLVQHAKSSSVSAVKAWLILKINLVAPTLWVWVGWLVEPFLDHYLAKLWDKGELGIFQIGAKELGKVQAADYRAKVYKLKSLPDDVSDEEWINAEKEADLAFAELINARK